MGPEGNIYQVIFVAFASEQEGTFTIRNHDTFKKIDTPGTQAHASV